MTISKRIAITLSTLALVCASYLASSSPALALGEPDTDVDDTSEQVAPAGGLEGKININSASAAELELLPGVGPSIAAKIIAYRNEHPFQQLNHIMRIKGIGKKTYYKMKPFLALDGETTLRSTK